MSHKKNFVSDLHLACANDELRPVFQCIHFINGYAYASDGSILIKQSLEYNNDVLNYESLDCKAIHMDSFKEIRKYQVVEVTEEGFDCTAKNGRKAFFPFAVFDEDNDKHKIPDFDAVWPRGITEVGELGIMPKYIGLLEKAMVSGNRLKMTFTGVDRGMLFHSRDENYQDQIAMIMPSKLD